MKKIQLDNNTCASNIKFIINIFAMIATVWIAYLTLAVYQNQLDLAAYQISPKFQIEVEFQPVDNTYDKSIRINNLGEPAKATFVTDAIMEISLNDKDKNIQENVFLEGYFDETADMINNGTAMTGLVCERSSSFADASIQGASYLASKKLNEQIDDRKIPVYENIFYLVKIDYELYNNKISSEYHIVGSFKNQKINEYEYMEILDTKYSLLVDSLNTEEERIVFSDEILKILNEMIQ